MSDALFREAVSAIDAGDVAGVERLLASWPLHMRGAEKDESRARQYDAIAAYLRGLGAPE